MRGGMNNPYQSHPIIPHIKASLIIHTFNNNSNNSSIRLSVIFPHLCSSNRIREDCLMISGLHRLWRVIMGSD
jgi:hypothetical protein